MSIVGKIKINDIFKRYYRATSYQGGFGIGLSIVNENEVNFSIEKLTSLLSIDYINNYREKSHKIYE